MKQLIIAYIYKESDARIRKGIMWNQFLYTSLLFSLNTILSGCFLKANVVDFNELIEQDITISSTEVYINSTNQKTFPLNGTCQVQDSSIQILVDGVPSGSSARCSGGQWSLNLDLSGKTEGPVIFSSQSHKKWFSMGSTTLTITKDSIPPEVGNFEDMNFGSDVATPQLEWWNTTDLGSGLQKYELALGTAPGLTDVVNWTDMSTQEKGSLSSLSLSHGVLYYPLLRAQDLAGNWSTPIAKNGFRAVKTWADQKPKSNKVYIETAVTKIKALPSGKTFISGDFTEVSEKYLGYNSFSHFDQNGVLIAPLEISNFGNVEKALLQSDGKVIILSENKLYRLKADLSLDSTFTQPALSANPYTIQKFIIQPNDQLIVVVNFTDSAIKDQLMRLNADGSVDSSFSTGLGFDYYPAYIDLQSDGKIIAAGSFSNVQGVSKSYIVRLDSTGTLDGTFSIGTGFNSWVNTIKIQSDDKIIVGGHFTTFDGASSSKVVRLQANGARDATFNVGSGISGGTSPLINDLAIQSDGKVLLAGRFTQYQGAAAGSLIRVNSDGSRDATFAGSGTTKTLASIILQGSKIIASMHTPGGPPRFQWFFTSQSLF